MQDITRGALHLAMQITGSHDEAMDILQTAVIKALEYRHAPRPGEDGYKAWFYRVVRNQAIDWLRYEKRFDRDAGIEDQVVDHDPGRHLHEAGRKLSLQRALKELDAEQREIICLKDFHDFSYAEIADIMGIEKGTVMSRLHRARMALKMKLSAMSEFAGGEYEM
jgi:RNA polymerase sigma-70 factor (ECF subfamily)